jgi:hypothetical protein
MAAQGPYQPFLIHLPAALSRRVRDILERPDTPYRDLNELVIAAIENQLSLWTYGQGELGEPLKMGLPAELPSRPSPQPVSEAGNLIQMQVEPQLLARPGEAQVRVLPPAGTGKALFVLTNRLSPIALATRVLVSLTSEHDAPDIARFIEESGRSARSLGQRIRAEDARAGRIGSERRFIGWPVGPAAEKSLERFRTSFLFSGSENSGPIIELGFAAIRDGRIYPTQWGVELARAPSPLLGEVPGWTLGAEQQRLFRQAILAIPAEVLEISTILHAVIDTDGTSFKIDNANHSRHPDWTPNRLVAHRAALLGRLRELGVVDIVEGAGAEMRVRVLPSANDFVEHVFKLTSGAKINAG